jgi:hypothetical protein
MIYFQLEKPRIERFFISMLKRKPQFLYEERNNNRAFRLQVYLEMYESYERLGMLICDEFLEDKTIIKYVDMLFRDLEVISEFDYRIYMNYLHYTKHFIEQLIKGAEEHDEFETAHNFSRVLVLFLKKYKN